MTPAAARPPSRTAPASGTAAMGALLQAFASRAEARAGEPAFLRAAREAAMARFGATGFPSTRDEAWRQTNISPIAQARLVPVGQDATDARSAPPAGANAEQQLAQERAALLRADGFVPLAARVHAFVNGCFDAALSTTLSTGSSAVGGSNAKARAAEGAVRNLAALSAPDLEAELGAVLEPAPGPAPAAEHPFACLNTAFFSDGALVRVPRGATAAEPMHVLFVSAPEAGAAAGPVILSCPRLLIVAAPGSRAVVLEEHVSLGRECTLSLPVTDVVVEEGAGVDLVRLNRLATAAWQVGLTRVRQGRDSRFGSSCLDLGGALSRHDLEVRLGGEGADCTLDGLSMADGKRHVDNHTLIDHTLPHGTSRELYKGIFDDEARGVFHGRIIVRPDAQKTDARQTNKNLILSGSALAHSIPQLEIHADDVQCRHGSTTGQLDEQMMFYLRSRGIAPDAARDVLVFGFAAEVLGRLRVPGLAASIESRLFAAAVRDGALEQVP